jgi:heme-degrading monooxygenase HmoA
MPRSTPPPWLIACGGNDVIDLHRIGKREGSNRAMMTVMTETILRKGKEPQWDEAYRRRAEAVTDQDGWISLQLLIPLDAPNKRVVLGTWRTRADWEAWHTSDVFRETREQMDAAEEVEERQDRWFEVVTHEPG